MRIAWRGLAILLVALGTVALLLVPRYSGRADGLLARLWLPQVGTGGVYVLPNHSSYQPYRPYGPLHIVGEVQNDSARYVRSVKVLAKLFDSGDVLVDSTYASTRLGSIPPRERGCFDIAFIGPVTQTARYELSVLNYTTDTQVPPRLAVTSDFGFYSPASHYYQIIGVVRNDDARSVAAVQVVGTLYDGTGKVMGCESGGLDPNPYVPYVYFLEAGQAEVFKVQFPSPNAPGYPGGIDYREASTYRLQASGTPYVPYYPQPTVAPAPTSVLGSPTPTAAPAATRTPTAAPSAPAVPHTLEGRSACTSCHLVGGTGVGFRGGTGMPADHQGFPDSSCASAACH